jgi:hypothetical protein
MPLNDSIAPANTRKWYANCCEITCNLDVLCLQMFFYYNDSIARIEEI